jgi:hypothetical protein
MDNPKPDAATNVHPDEPDARRRRDAGLPTKEEPPNLAHKEPANVEAAIEPEDDARE